MNDRLRFRARIYSTINRDEEDEKEISFYIYNVAVYQYGDIGFSHDQLTDALNKLDLTDKQKEEIEEEIAENSYCEDYEWYSIEFGQVEQCTGLKDKNGKLIYEGDIVCWILCRNDADVEENYQIVWRDDCAAFGCRKSTGVVLNMFAQPELRAIIIGNVHENKELLND